MRDYQIVFELATAVVIARDEHTFPGLIFVPVPEPKTVKNRVHLDLNPDDREAEVERLVGLGAGPVDVGQGPDVTGTVLADPEGNEFCVLKPRPGVSDLSPESRPRRSAWRRQSPSSRLLASR